jgi:hypothetical protein
MKKYGGMEAQLHYWHQMSWLVFTPQLLNPGEIALGAHWTGSRVGSRASLDTMEYRKISCHCPESNPGCPAHCCTKLSWLPIIVTSTLKKSLPLLNFPPIAYFQYILNENMGVLLDIILGKEVKAVKNSLQGYCGRQLNEAPNDGSPLQRTLWAAAGTIA